MRSNTKLGGLRVHVFPFRLGIDGETPQTVCNGQQHKRDDFRPISRDSSSARAEDTGPRNRRTFRVPGGGVRPGASAQSDLSSPFG